MVVSLTGIKVPIFSDLPILNERNIRKHINASIYIHSSKEITNKDPEFKIGGIVRISKYKNIFAKGYVSNWSEEVFVIKKAKNTVPRTYVISDLKGEEIVGTFYEKELQKKSKRV